MGRITTFDDPNAGTAAEQGTGGLAINASGMIAGTYADANSVLHGFIYDSSTLTPTTTTLTPAPTPNPSDLLGASDPERDGFRRRRCTIQRRDRLVPERHNDAGNGNIERWCGHFDHHGACDGNRLDHGRLWRRFGVCRQHLDGGQPDGQQGQFLDDFDIVAQSLHSRAIRDPDRDCQRASLAARQPARWPSATARVQAWAARR